MDPATLTAYDDAAADYCDEWLGQPPPTDLQALWRRYFAPGEPSVDIGSGSGRDVDWLNRNGYPCIGFDASRGLLIEARRRFPHWQFEQAALPELQGVAPRSFRNVVCETVLMHLSAELVHASVCSLAKLLVDDGTLYLSWRVSEAGDVRDHAGRLYSAFSAEAVRAALRDLELLHDAESMSESSGRKVRRMIARRR